MSSTLSPDRPSPSSPLRLLFLHSHSHIYCCAEIDQRHQYDTSHQTPPGLSRISCNSAYSSLSAYSLSTISAPSTAQARNRSVFSLVLDRNVRSIARINPATPALDGTPSTVFVGEKTTRALSVGARGN